MEGVKTFVSEARSLIKKYQAEENLNACKGRIINSLRVSVETIEQTLGSNDAVVTKLRHKVDQKTDELQQSLNQIPVLYDAMRVVDKQCKEMLEDLLSLHREIQLVQAMRSIGGVDQDNTVDVETANTLYSANCPNLQLRADPPIAQGVLATTRTVVLEGSDNKETSNVQPNSTDPLNNIGDLKVVFEPLIPKKEKDCN